MKLPNLVKPGDRMDVEMDKKTYRSNVQDIESDETVLITQVTDGRLPINVPVGALVRLVFFKPDGMFYFPAVMRGWKRTGLLRMMRFEATGEVERWQARGSYRLRSNVPVRIWYNHPTDDPAPRPPGMPPDVDFKSYTVDISSTGILIAANVGVDIGQVLSCEMQVSNDTKLTLECKVMRVEEPTERNAPFRWGLVFTDITPHHQRDLSRFIMREQIVQRSRV